MVMLVLVSAVRLSPMIRVMGLRSLASIVIVFSGVITTGRSGSSKSNQNVHMSNVNMLSVIINNYPPLSPTLR